MFRKMAKNATVYLSCRELSQVSQSDGAVLQVSQNDGVVLQVSQNGGEVLEFFHNGGITAIGFSKYSIAPGPLAVTAGYEWQRTELRIFSFKGTRGFFTRSSCGFFNFF